MSDRSQPTTLLAALRDLAGGLAAALLFSLLLSSLMLAVPLYSMQLFDRVLTSGHLETLLLLTAIVSLALATFGALEAVRTSILARLATRLGERLTESLLAACVERGLAGRATGGQLLQDLSTIRQTIGGSAIQALFDFPWLPLSVAVIWLLHPQLGLLALASAVLLAFLALLNERATRRPLAHGGAATLAAQGLVESLGRRAELVHAMGLLPALAGRVDTVQRVALAELQKAADRGGLVMGLTRALRLLVQAAVMGLGAWLALDHQLTGGTLLAASILLSRALAPVEQMVGAWRLLSQAREAARRLAPVLAERSALPQPMRLPEPSGQVAVEAATVITADGRAILRQVGFSLDPGQVLGVIGPSAAGKSTLCRLLIGAVSPSGGCVRLDGAEMHRFERAEIGRHIGYLPQEPGLFAGSIAENIARMAEAPDPEAVVAAAQLAGVHEMILALPQGYDTLLADTGAPLSGGQRQRIGLARALYGTPRLVILDEPNASLDAAGDEALIAAITALKRKGCTVVIACHRQTILAVVDKLLVLEQGVAVRCGDRDQVLQGLLRPVRAA